jgi:uncharacterized protein (UPF0335 family)
MHLITSPQRLFVLTLGLGLMVWNILNPNLVQAATVAPTLIPISPVTNVTDVPASQTGQVNENLKKIIDKVVEENKDTIDAKLQDIKDRKRGMVAEVKAVREGALTVKSLKSTQVIPLDASVILTKSGKVIAIDAISVGDWIVVIGAFKDDAFKPTHIIVSPTSLQPLQPVIKLGTIDTLGKTELKFSDRATSDVMTWKIAKTTLWQDSLGEKTLPANFTTSLQALFVGVEADGGTTLRIVKALAPFAKPTKPGQ